MAPCWLAEGSPAGRDYDIAVVLKGPTEAIRLREKHKVAGIWINAQSTAFRSAPSFYALASSRPIDRIVDDRTAAIYELGLPWLQLSPIGAIDPAEQARFSAIYRGSNPESPQNTYGRAATARINIASISLINQNVVSVRYMRTITRGDEVRTSHWVATLTYSYANAPMSSTDRLVNPLGFAVSEYRADPEAIN